MIDSPISREGAFLANNVVFTVFAFIVLLGTVFPLIVEAVQDRQIAVGAPFFDRLSIPIGITLLFLMARRARAAVAQGSRSCSATGCSCPAWCGARALAFAVIQGADGWPPLLAFTLGGFAAGAALRQLVLATRRQGWRGLVGRANGGMIVHLGVILIAVALAASNGYTRSASSTLQVRASRSRSTGTPSSSSRSRTSETRARRRVERARWHRRQQGLRPGAHQLHQHGHGHPHAERADRALRTTSTSPSRTRRQAGATEVQVEVFLKPMILWLWIGGALMAIGTVLSAFPGTRRRRPTEPSPRCRARRRPRPETARV